MAQSKVEENGWAFYSYQQKIVETWRLSADIQFRSADNYQYLKIILLRQGLNYSITEKQTAPLGYTYFGNWERENGKKDFEPEHRIWEQYAH